MKSPTTRLALIVMITLILCAVTMAGCTGDQLRDKADKADYAAQKIRDVLDTYEPDQIEASELAAAIVEALPESFRDQAESVIEVAGDVRLGVSGLANTLDQIANDFRDQADEEAGNTKNAVFGVLSVTEALLGTNGVLAAVGGLFWNRQRKSKAVVEDIVLSIESSPQIRKAIDDGGGQHLSASMNAGTRRAVAAIKSSVKTSTK